VLKIKISILGAGNAGVTIAADLSLRGYDVTLYSRASKRLEAILKRGGVRLKGLTEGFAYIRTSADIKKAVEGADLIFVTAIASAHEDYAKICAPYLKDGQIICLFAGYLGSLIFNKIIKENRKGKLNLFIAETNTVPYACRFFEREGEAEVYLATKPAIGVFPSKDTEKVVEVVKELYPKIHPARNVVEAGLSNANIIWHPVGTLLNAGWIETSGGEFYLWRQAMTRSVLQVVEAVYREKGAIFKALGNYTDHAPFTSVKRAQENPSFQKIKDPPDLKHRYITEDVPYGLVCLSSMGKLLGVPTPVIDSLIVIASIINDTDYWKEGRTCEKIGIAGMSAEELNKFLEIGAIL
jgi:opine dehydrogenase